MAFHEINIWFFFWSRFWTITWTSGVVQLIQTFQIFGGYIFLKSYFMRVFAHIRQPGFMKQKSPISKKTHVLCGPLHPPQTSKGHRCSEFPFELGLKRDGVWFSGEDTNDCRTTRHFGGFEDSFELKVYIRKFLLLFKYIPCFQATCPVSQPFWKEDHSATGEGIQTGQKLQVSTSPVPTLHNTFHIKNRNKIKLIFSHQGLGTADLFQVIWGGCAVLGSSMLEWLQQLDQNKSPVGSTNQKFVCTYFMVKLRINQGSSGLFWFNLGWGLWVRKENVNVVFSGFLGQKCSNLAGCKVWDRLGQIAPYLRIYKYLETEVYEWNVVWGLSQSYLCFCDGTPICCDIPTKSDPKNIAWYHTLRCQRSRLPLCTGSSHFFIVVGQNRLVFLYNRANLQCNL